MEEEFLKEHPGLKGKRIEGWECKVLDLDGNVIPSDNQFYSEETIHETQLDKQKVKGVLKKLFPQEKCFCDDLFETGEIGCEFCIKTRLEKELNLE